MYVQNTKHIQTLEVGGSVGRFHDVIRGCRPDTAWMYCKVEVRNVDDAMNVNGGGDHSSFHVDFPHRTISIFNNGKGMSWTKIFLLDPFFLFLVQHESVSSARKLSHKANWVTKEHQLALQFSLLGPQLSKF